MRDVVLAQRSDEMIPAGLPPGTRVAHRTGSLAAVLHDAAIVYPAGDRHAVQAQPAELHRRGPADARDPLLPGEHRGGVGGVAHDDREEPRVVAPVDRVARRVGASREDATDDAPVAGWSQTHRPPTAHERLPGAGMTRVGLEPTTYGLKVRCSTT